MAKKKTPSKAAPKKKSVKKTKKKAKKAKKTTKKKRSKKISPAKKKETTAPRRLSSLGSASELLERASAAYFLHRDELSKLPGVEDVSVGPRYESGQPTDQLAIRLHMSSPAAKEKLRLDAIAGKGELRPLYDGVPIDLVVWKFKTCANGAPADGSELNSDGGRGTLGTSVTLPNGDVYWLTASHVISTSLDPDLPSDVAVRNASNTVIGAVPSGDGFIKRNRLVDGALVKPTSTLPAIPLNRSTEYVLSSSVNRRVRMRGASNDSDGRIDSVLNTGFSIENNGIIERVEEHYLVRGDDGVFAEPGDSGAIVTDSTDPRIILGQVRAVAGSLTVVSQIVNVKSQLLFIV